MTEIAISYEKETSPFLRDDILICLGKISLILPSVWIRDEASITENDKSTRESIKRERTPEHESQCVYQVSNEEYEDFLLDLTDENKPISYDNRIVGIKVAIDMKESRVLCNLIEFSKTPIDLEKNPEILKILMNKNNAVSSTLLLNNCTTCADNYPDLLHWADNTDKDIARLVGKKICKDQVDDVINEKLLTMAFSYLKDGEIELFKLYIAISKDINANINNMETFLTKMISELNLKQLEEATKACTFDINKHNKEDKAPIIIACEQQDEDKVNLLMTLYGSIINNDDMLKAYRTVYNMEDKDKIRKMAPILQKYEKRATEVFTNK